MEQLSECPNCKGKEFSPFLLCIDHTVSKEEFKIVACTKCNFIITNPRPKEEEIGRYYESDDYISHSNTSAGLINKIYHFVKKRAIKRKIHLIESLKPNSKNILDIGCGTGSFLSGIKLKGWNAMGIEPNQKARNFAINNYSVIVEDEGALNTLKDNSQNIITLWHVLEHVHQLNKRISDIKRLLDNNGYAIIAVPNYTAWDAKHYMDKWAAYDVPRHLYHFSPEIIKSLFTQQDLKWVKSYPMKMDSFYVSMLSEKYRKSNLQIFRAFLSGLISNLKSNGNPENYSSVIYVFKKTNT